MGDSPVSSAGRPRRRSRSILAWTLLLLAYGGLAFAYLIPETPEGSRAGDVAQFVAFAFRTFTFHAGLLFLFAWIWMAAFRLWRPAIAGLPVLAITMLPAAVAYLPKSPTPVRDSITVMSMNLLVRSGSPAAAVREINRLNPDIVLVQEYSAEAHAVMEPALRNAYPHIITGERDDAFGQAVYSKLALIEPPKLFPPAALGAGGRAGGVVNLRDPQIRIVVMLGEREVVVQNLHTVPPISASHVAEQRKLLRWVAEFVSAETRPVIVGGDFNATDESLAVLRDAGLENSHAMAGRGRSLTWHDTGWMTYFPGVRIDHIFVSGGLRCDRWDRANPIGSDHRPIVARIGFGS